MRANHYRSAAFGILAAAFLNVVPCQAKGLLFVRLWSSAYTFKVEPGSYIHSMTLVGGDTNALAYLDTGTTFTFFHTSKDGNRLKGADLVTTYQALSPVADPGAGITGGNQKLCLGIHDLDITFDPNTGDLISVDTRAGVAASPALLTENLTITGWGSSLLNDGNDDPGVNLNNRLVEGQGRLQLELTATHLTNVVIRVNAVLAKEDASYVEKVINVLMMPPGLWWLLGGLLAGGCFVFIRLRRPKIGRPTTDPV